MRALVAFVAAAALAALASAGQAAAPTLDARLGLALHAPGIAPARTAAVAVDLQTNAIVYSTHADVPLLPASAEKLPVSFAALRLLGPSYRFRTEVVGDGEKSGHAWDGDLDLVGYGDPTLAESDLRALARDVARWGI